MADNELVASFGPEHDLAAFAQSEAGAYPINCVHYDPDRGYAEVTDGRILMRVPVPRFDADAYPPLIGPPPSPVEDPVLIPADALSRIVMAAANAPVLSPYPYAGRVRFGIGPRRENGQHLAFHSSDRDVETTAVMLAGTGKFPSADEVIPTGDPAVSVRLSPLLLRRLAEYVEKHGANGSATPIRFQFFTDHKGRFDSRPVRFSFRGNPDSSQDRETEGLMMPIHEK